MQKKEEPCLKVLEARFIMKILRFLMLTIKFPICSFMSPKLSTMLCRVFRKSTGNLKCKSTAVGLSISGCVCTFCLLYCYSRSKVKCCGDAKIGNWSEHKKHENLHPRPRGCLWVKWRTSDQRGFSDAFVSDDCGRAEHSSPGSNCVSSWPWKWEFDVISCHPFKKIFKLSYWFVGGGGEEKPIQES